MSDESAFLWCLLAIIGLGAIVALAGMAFDNGFEEGYKCAQGFCEDYDVEEIDPEVFSMEQGCEDQDGFMVNGTCHKKTGRSYR